MRIYEELFIVKPDAPEEEVDAYIGQVKDLITSGKGTIEKADKWGTRKLAYKVQKYNEGIYVLIQFSSSPDLVKEVERRMRVTDLVIKFITVRIDEKMKKIEKRKKQRDKRAIRRPPPPPAVPALPSEPAPAVPGAPGAHAAPGAPAAAAPAPAPAAPAAPAPAAVVEPKEQE
jgi:small subunit ribosomal protein S6